ncbi:hypothetical protein [Oceanimonas baumannii]|uniref:DNA-binding protein n=1 Tax=Oceanimonas baumannii TaxID=129578 RepID=A0A235CJL0_9GAMM|nr:hypothetical protein [Oceanimonas baumannii]OYD24720.1 hypothetical protein B6S09_08845 [Oceanimonas baumannii]TDW59467.1 hypothetical protein LY04_01718 [Oceanimonas baumannii]
MKQLNVTFDTPICTPDVFAERVGISKCTVDRMVKDGRIPILPKKIQGERTLINLMALSQSALDLYQPPKPRGPRGRSKAA